MSVRQIALKAGIDYVQLSKNLKNEDWNPAFDTMEKIGDALGYSISIRAEKKKNG
jgi:DNA-binding phage protein